MKNKYDIATADLAQMSDTMSTEELAETLKDWARIGNTKATKMKKIDEHFSPLIEVSSEKGGKFGQHTSYKDRETILDELARIQRSVPLMTKQNLEIESAFMKDLEKGIKLEPTPSNDEKIRHAYAWFRDGYGMQAQSIYDDIKNIMAQAPEQEYITQAYYLILRLSQERAQKSEVKQEDFNKGVTLKQSFGRRDLR